MLPPAFRPAGNRMPRLRFGVPRGRCLVVAGLALAGLAGCREEDQIVRYRVPKPHVVARSNPGTRPDSESDSSAPREATDRMLAAIVPSGDKAWFFKLTGPKDAVAALDPPFRQFLASLKFARGANEPPAWSLPSGWNEGPGDQIRHAIIQIPSQPQPLELTVTVLEKPADDDGKYVLENVNRWRRQMQLPPLTAIRLADETEELEIPAGTATVVDLLGNLGGGGMGPFAGGSPSGGVPLRPAAERPPPTAAPDDMTFDVPSEWQPGRLTAMRKAAFEARDGDATAEITVIAASGDLLANVNRWRVQIGLEQITADELAQTAREIDAAGGKGSYVELVGPGTGEGPKSTFAAVAERGGQQWFFKLTGDAAVVERERERFLAFVKSVKFPPAEAGHGD